MRARTIWVVFARKSSQNLVLHFRTNKLVYLGLKTVYWPRRLSPMALQRVLAEAGGRVPETDCQVPAARSKQPAVGRKRHRSDTQTAKSLKKIVLTYWFC